MKNIEYYADIFNSQDEECYANEIKNDDAADWMSSHIPVLECPDKDIESVYYYRWWTYRKHIKHTSDGYVITEFLPDVPWAGKHNTINAATGFHIAEGKWITNGCEYIEDYIRFWLDGKGKTHAYSSWLVWSIYMYCRHKGDFAIAKENFDKICAYVKEWENTHLCENVLFWSVDDRDAMEYTISGTTPDLKPLKGFRPTLNSYMAAEYYALSEIAKICGYEQTSELYSGKYEKLKNLLNSQLWNDGFYKACNFEDEDGNPVLKPVSDDMNVRELIGYIPWYFNLAPEGREDAFNLLKSDKCFLSEYGLTTCDMSHKRYLYEVDHECLWNGYIWPFATSQTLGAVINLLRNYNQKVITKDDFYSMLLKYAKQHYRITEEGKKIFWIDEVIDPRDGKWSSREILKNSGWQKNLGGYERGKDYNHSCFCDFVLGGLCGIGTDDDGKVKVNPLIPDWWDWFCVDNVELGGKKYTITFDRNGTKYGSGKGISVKAK